MTGFAQIAHGHAARYPLMQPQDYVKLAYQSEFGPAHMIPDADAAAKAIADEWETASGAFAPCNPEPVGGGYCRYHLTDGVDPIEAAPALAAAFVQSAASRAGTMEGLHRKLETLLTLSIDGMEAYVRKYRQQGCPAVHHSEAYRNAYHPHYRILLEALAEGLPQPRTRQKFPVCRHEDGEGFRYRISTVTKTVSLA